MPRILVMIEQLKEKRIEKSDLMEILIALIPAFAWGSVKRLQRCSIKNQ